MRRIDPAPHAPRYVLVDEYEQKLQRLAQLEKEVAELKAELEVQQQLQKEMTKAE